MARPSDSHGAGRRRGDLRPPARRATRVAPAARPAARTPLDVAAAAQLACLLEASAPKPGNVAPGDDRAFHDTRYEDFLASAVAIGPAFALAGRRRLGTTILAATNATARWTRANTNLGIVLLLAPLAAAALERRRGTLRDRLRRVLHHTTVRDAASVYAAIRQAEPGGLGQVPEEDVARPPSRTLREVMALAAERDGVAREYATDYEVTFGVGAPAVRRARRDGLTWNDAIVETYLTLLATSPDTLIARKLGRSAAVLVARQSRAALQVGGVRTSAGRRRIAQLDRSLRDARNARNPGTTADLTAAAIYAVLLDGGWS